ncbi:MAG TPA: bifunctional DNA-formamidopyrimidine glycosylase/DNA-(apurinic or apyrimidinic site) lyase [Candidatus Binatia bacterium]|nr:bifunctional DNA-formamidopyrimidine glycosylase/DNA-(apurinic or apyrimidinic site) lyase [Candidatus Binatia bacterium]
MPELPEVETIRRGLDRRLRGARIVRVEIREPRLRRVVDRAALESLVGRRVERIERRAKYLLADVGEGLVWLMHLGMSGRLLLLPAGAPAAAHEHVRVEFDDGGVLCYRDPRRFGWMRVAPRGELAELAGLGPEPLTPRLRAASLRERLRGTRRDVKAALLDQRVLAGIGNIYANEILFRAGIRPTRRCHRLTMSELGAIARATRAVLSAAVERRGTSFSDYFDSDGVPGTFQQVLAVFDRGGAPCRRCGTSIKRRPHGGRSSFYCPSCQR